MELGIGVFGDLAFDQTTGKYKDAGVKIREILEQVKFMDEVGIDVADWHTEGLKPEDWPGFGSVQKTSAEFRNAYDTFAAKCVNITKEVVTS